MQIADIAHYVRLETPGVMDIIIVQTLAAVAKDFCTRTLVWNEIQDPFSLIDGIPKYDIDAPSGATVIGVTDVWQGRRRLDPVTQAGLALALPDWQDATAAEPSFFNVANDHRLLTVYPTPALAQGAPLTLRVRYAPTRIATVLPDFLVDEHLDALVNGAKARLFAQVNVPWSNPGSVLVPRMDYEQAVTDARIKELHANVPSSLRVQPRRFG